MTTPPEQEPSLEDYAIVVGINRYLKLSSLKGARRDAWNFQKWLTTERPKGAGLSGARIFPCTLFRSNRHEPNKEQLDLQFREIMQDFEKSRRKHLGRRLYIFLSGHGVAHVKDPEQTALLLANADRNYTKYLVGRRYAEAFSYRGIFQEVVLFMDCCRDVDWDLSDPECPFPYKLEESLAGKGRRFYGYAAKIARKSREREISGKYQGVFTRALLDGLNGAAADDNGQITTLSLKSYLQWRIKELCGELQAPDFGKEDHLVISDGHDVPRMTVRIHAKTRKLDDFVILNSFHTRVYDANVTCVSENVYDVTLRPGQAYIIGIPNPAGTPSYQPLNDDGQPIIDVGTEQLQDVTI